MDNIAIFPNLEKDPKLEFTEKTAEEIARYKKKVLLSAELLKHKKISRAEYLEKDELLKKADLVVALGGDGTILGAAKAAADYSVPVMGINIGHLGFLSQAEKGDLSVFSHIFSGDFEVLEQKLLEVCIHGGGKKEAAVHYAFNDAVIRGADSKMVTLCLSADDTVMNEYSADGVIFSTANGSTAYSMSAGGPVIHPELDCIVITPVCPHSLNVRSLVVPKDKKIFAKIIPPYRCEAVLSVDGERVSALEAEGYASVGLSQKSVRLLKIPGRNFFDVIREKLNFR